MIRINLLPTKIIKKQAAIKREIGIFIFTIVVLLALIGGYWFIQKGAIGTLNDQVAKLKQDQTKLQNQVKELNELEARLLELENKVNVIRKLEESRRGPVRVLDEISTRVPAPRAWLTELTQKGGSLSLKGMAEDNETIAGLMRSLEDSDYLANVQLLQSKEKVINDIPFKDFSINLTSVNPVSVKDEKDSADAPKEQ